MIIVGAGITGAFLAERLTRDGRDVLVLDRHAPQTASTAASTALLQWEIDAPMLELEDQLGFESAANVYRRSFESVRRIGDLVQALGRTAGFARRDTIYFAGSDLDPILLKEELRLRLRAELPSALLEREALLARFGFDRSAALVSSGSAEVDRSSSRGTCSTPRWRAARASSLPRSWRTTRPRWSPPPCAPAPESRSAARP